MRFDPNRCALIQKLNSTTVARILRYVMACAWILFANGCHSYVESTHVIHVHAGSDQTVNYGEAILLDGSRSQFSPLDFLVADGSGPMQDHLVRFHSHDGLSSVGPFRDALNKVCGWPGDIIRVDGSLIGIHITKRRLVLLDPATCRSSYLTHELTRYSEMTGLALHPQLDILVVDAKRRELFRVSLDGNECEPLHQFELEEVSGLAYSHDLRQLLVIEKMTNSLHELDLSDGTTRCVADLSVQEGEFFDELCFFDGSLYGTLTHKREEVRSTQLCRIDLSDGTFERISPTIQNSAGHALVINSVPETFEWTRVSGPGDCDLRDPTQLFTTASVSEPGEHVFQLTVVGSIVHRATVTVVVGERETSP